MGGHAPCTKAGGRRTTTVTLGNEKATLRPCWKCGGKSIEIHDCGYSSFNVGHAKCLKCGYAVKCSPTITNPLKIIAKAWNSDKTKVRRQVKSLEKEAAHLRELLNASDVRGEK